MPGNGLARKASGGTTMEKALLRVTDCEAHQPAATEDPLELKLWPATPRSVHRARHDLLAVLATWEMSELADTAGLVLAELMTNATQHGRVPDREIGTWFGRVPDGIRIEVHDAKDTAPRLRTAAPDDERGRGLALVDALTGGRWGVTRRKGPGKSVWAELTSGAAPDEPTRLR
jgi:serine/threonine-protein kinase RsbW